MLKRFFITGTDTSVGKTVVSRALLQALASSGKSVAGYNLPRAEQRELGQYIRLSMLGSVLAVDRIMA